MSWEIDLFKSVGSVEFGRKREDIRYRIAEDPVVYAQSEAVIPHDTYEEQGLFVMYDKYNRCAAVEFMKPINLLWKGLDLFNMGFEQLRDYFLKLDPYLAESEKDFTSFYLGISAFAPDKNPTGTTKIESITVFRENHFNQKIGICDPEIFSTFMIQCPENIGNLNLVFSGTLTEMWEMYFSKNTENVILLWNSHPVALSFKDDIPLLIDAIIRMLDTMIKSPTSGKLEVTLSAKNIESRWFITYDDKRIGIRSEWIKLPGKMETTLNHWSYLTMLKNEFLWEWRTLLEVLKPVTTKVDRMMLRTDDLQLLSAFDRLYGKIDRTGRFYRTESRGLKRGLPSN